MAVTIQEDYCLPSKGKIYNKMFDPHVKLRSMTVAEEMKRLAHSETPYAVMSEIIESCLLTPLPIKVYDLCLGDYTYLLHKLRVVTYGPDYKITFTCPKCLTQEKVILNLDELEINEFKDDILKNMSITLPKSQKIFKLKFQTPRDLDRISQRKKEMMKEYPEMADPTYLLTLASLIDTVDGAPLNPLTGLESLKNLPMMDTTVLAQRATKLNEAIGVAPNVKLHCAKCGGDYESPFRYTPEFFGPTYD